MNQQLLDKDEALRLVEELAPEVLRGNASPLNIKVAFTVDEIWSCLGNFPKENEFGLWDIGTEKDKAQYHSWIYRELIWLRLPTTRGNIIAALQGLKHGSYDPM